MLLFKDIKQNYPVYILDKQELTLIEGKVTQVSFPHLESSQRPGGIMGQQPMVIDVTISAGGKVATYTIPEHLCITDAGSTLVLSTEKETLIHEVEAMKNNAIQVLSTIDRQKDIIDKSEKLLVELNPATKEKAAYEKRFKSIESSVGDIKEILLKLVEEKKKK